MNNCKFAGSGRPPGAFLVRPPRKNQRNALRCAGHLGAVLSDGPGYWTVLLSSLRELPPRYLLDFQSLKSLTFFPVKRQRLICLPVNLLVLE
jgi:hypothetical protein